MGRNWNGKAFYDSGEGINRFYSKSNNETAEKEHTFDYAVESSRLLPDTQSVILRYNKHQSFFSLWRTMMDEIRILPLLSDYEILIGMGCMAWSGGMLNASPFCLYRNRNQSDK